MCGCRRELCFASEEDWSTVPGERENRIRLVGWILLCVATKKTPVTNIGATEYPA